MPHIMVQHSYESESGMPADSVLNTFHFEGPTVADAAASDALAAIVCDFYTATAPTATGNLEQWMAMGAFSIPQHSVKVYNMGDAKPRVPVSTYTETSPTFTVVAPMVAEAAVCLSYRGTVGSGMAMARRRGRIYIGPLNFNAGTADTTFLRPHANFRADLTKAGRMLALDAQALGYDWSVFSPTTEAAIPPGGGGDFPLTPIVAFWVDDAFDTIRSRGPAPTTRTQLSVA